MFQFYYALCNDLFIFYILLTLLCVLPNFYCISMNRSNVLEDRLNACCVWSFLCRRPFGSVVNKMSIVMT